MDYLRANEFIRNKGISLPNGQVFLTQPVGVFKKVYGVDPSRFSYTRINDILKLSKQRYRFPAGQDLSSLKGIYRDTIRRERESLVASLMLPVGTIVNLGNGAEGSKMRASRAICWSISTLRGKLRNIAFSGHDEAFVYFPVKNNPYAVPLADFIETSAKHMDHRGLYDASYLNPSSFCTDTRTCAPGIHFFVDLKDAKAYNL